MRISGIIPAFVSPLNEDNTIKEQIARKLIEYELSMGADGFYICGATGEGVVMQVKEREKLCEIVIDQVKKRKPVINHIGAIDLETAIKLAKHAEKSGADCIASIPPFYFKYDSNDIYNYYKKLAGSVNIPVMIYYHPPAQSDMSAELISRIFKIENVTSVKWSSSNFFELLRLKEMTNGEINIINGPDELLLCGLSAGADGGIGTTYNIMLKEYKDIYDCFVKGKIDEARNIQMKVNKVTEILLKHTGIPCTKFAIELLGFDVGNSTYPMKRYTAKEKEVIKVELSGAGWPFDTLEK